MNNNEAIPGMVPTLTGTHAVMIDPKNGHYGWVFFKHPDGGWVSCRKASEAEFKAAQLQALALIPGAHEFIGRPKATPEENARLSAALDTIFSPGKGEGVSRQEKIRQLAMTNPIVKGCLDMQRDPAVLYADALEMMVIALVDQNTALTAKAVDERLRSLTPAFTQQGIDAIRANYGHLVDKETPRS